MSRIEIDTNEIYNYSKDIIKSSEELVLKFNDLFKRIENVPLLTKEWIGSSSIRYVNIVKNEEEKYYKYVDDLKMYGKTLSSLALDFDNAINEMKAKL